MADINRLIDHSKVGEKKYTESPSFAVVLALTIDNPVLSDKAIAQLAGRTPAFVTALRKSDVFQTKLADKLEQLYGATRGRIRLQLAKVVAAALTKAERILESETVTVGEVTALVKELMPAMNINIANSGPNSGGNNQQVTIVLPVGTLQEARQRAMDMSKSSLVQSDVIDVPQLEDFRDEPIQRTSLIESVSPPESEPVSRPEERFVPGGETSRAEVRVPGPRTLEIDLSIVEDPS